MTKQLSSRLLDTITPIRYDLHLWPDMDKFTFQGEESITLQLQKPGSSIALHARNVAVTQVVLVSSDAQYVAQISHDSKSMQVQLEFGKQLPKGEYQLHVTFNGTIGDKLQGWYKSAYQVDGETRYMATTQFEEIGAREVFPCIDDPSAKAIFAITLTIPEGLTAISNTVEQSTTVHDDKTKTVVFAPTPKMATYALAIIVGEFESVETVAPNKVKVRVFVTPGKKSQAQFALATAAQMIAFYAQYFDIAYPLPILDLIAIPDFDAGAMENWGAVTFREAAVLIDKKESSAANKQWVATVIAHELTHMWFGNLVTMEWWDDLWLNEGFASYMEYVGVNEFFPQWNVWEQFAVLDHNRALALDSLKNTHAIQAHITDVEQIAEIFDAVSYSKGASVIQMLATYLGEEDFRKGLQFYLKKYSYGNAQTADLWEALEHASGKKVKQIMDGYTNKPGHPLIRVSLSSNKLELSQTRFFASSKVRESTRNELVWSIPLKVAQSDGLVEALFDTKSLLLPLSKSWIKVNAGESSFARSVYSQELYDRLEKPIRNKELESVDRMGILRDSFDSAESGYHSVVLALRLASFYQVESSYIVWASLAGKLAKVENLLSDPDDLSAYYTFARNILADIGKKVGWEKRKTDSHEDILLRSTILASLGMYKDEKILLRARELFAQLLKNKRSVDTDIRGVVYATVARNGGKTEFAQLQRLYQEEDLPAEKNRIGSAMCLFEDPELIKKTLEFALSTDVRTQDIGRFLVGCFNNAKGRQVTWEFIKAHWGELIKKMDGLGLSWMVEGGASVTSPALLADMQTFFKTHPHPKLNLVMQQVLEQIESNIAWIARDREKIEKYLTHFV